jgi:acyl carrier protein
MSSTFETVREMIVDQFQLDPALVTPEATLESLKIDSLATVEFMFLLEEKYNFQAASENVDLRTVQDLVNEIDRLVGAQPGTAETKKGAA